MHFYSKVRLDFASLSDLICVHILVKFLFLYFSRILSFFPLNCNDKSFKMKQNHHKSGIIFVHALYSKFFEVFCIIIHLL